MPTFQTKNTSFLHLQKQICLFKMLNGVLEEESELFLSEDRIDVNHLLLSSSSGSLDINGSYSKNEEERLYIRIDQFDVSQLNSFTGLINLSLEGKMSALFTYLSGNEKPRFYGKSYFDNLHLNNEQLGTLFMFAEAPQHSSPIFWCPFLA